MAMHCVFATKRKQIAEILENPTYMPDSGVIEQLTERLMGLSGNNIALLKMVIDLKVQAAREGQVDG